jgi:hypothetical protein
LYQERDNASRFIVYGDMGAKMSNMTRAAIENLRRTQSINAVLHVGDFAYDLHSEDGKVGSLPTTARVLCCVTAVVTILPLFSYLG